MDPTIRGSESVMFVVGSSTPDPIIENIIPMATRIAVKIAVSPSLAGIGNESFNVTGSIKNVATITPFGALSETVDPAANSEKVEVLVAGAKLNLKV